MSDNPAMKLIRQVALVPLIVGTAVCVSATERVDVSLVASGFIGWLFLPLLQVLTGLVLVHGSALGVLRSLEAYFETQWAWSLWAIAAAAAFHLVPALRLLSWLVIPTAIVPAIVTPWLLLHLCRDVLRLSPAAARRRVALHQAITWAFVLAAIVFAVDLWPRIVTVLS